MKVKTAAMEINCHFVVFAIAIATCHRLNHLNFAVDPLRRRICDTMLEVDQKIVKMLLQRLGRSNDWLQPKVRRPEVPRIEVFLRAFLICI